MVELECCNCQTYGISVCTHHFYVLFPDLQCHLAWNIACGFAQNESQLLAFRFLAGLGGSAALAVSNACY